MAKITKKIRAQELRRKGHSISEIAEELDMTKSGTISRWCRDIVLTPEQIERLAEKQERGGRKGRLKFLEKVRKERIKEVELMRKRGIAEIGKLSKRELFLVGVGIYWSEGYTSSSNEQVGFTNSDPKMVLFMLRWFKEICKVSKDRFSLSIRINKKHKDRIEEIEKFWSKFTNLPLKQFNKTILIKSKSKKTYSNRKDYYGTLRIVVLKGTRLRRKINGWIEGLTEELEIEKKME